MGFSIIMLNTDLHNPNIKPERKMSLPSFYRQCEGVNGGEDLPKECVPSPLPSSLLASLLSPLASHLSPLLASPPSQWPQLGPLHAPPRGPHT